MRNVTFSIDEDLLAAGTEYARQRGTTLDEVIRQALSKVIKLPDGDRLASLFDLADKAKGRSSGPWKRGELYDE